jgi:hypothetical protein
MHYQNSSPQIRYKLARWAECKEDPIMIECVRLFHQLKYLIGKSLIAKNYKSRLPEFLSYTGLSEKRFMELLRKLRQLTWVYFNERHLLLHSERMIYQLCKLNHFIKTDPLIDLHFPVSLPKPIAEQTA